VQSDQEGIKDMTRNLKALGLALLAVFALGAVMASAASAEGTDVKTDHFTSTSGNEKTILTGEQVGTEAENVFGVKAVSALGVHCKKATYGGTVVGNSVIEVTVVPTYFECSSNLGAATVTNDRCAFVLTGTTDEHPNTAGTKEEIHATVHLECSHEKGNLGKLKIVTGGCEFIFQSTHPEGTTVNQNLLGATYTNEGSGSTADVKVDATVDKIHYTTKGFACGLAGLPETGTDGFLTTKVTVKGYRDQADSGPKPWQDAWSGLNGAGLPEEGAQVGISVS
jgi:hypothetical protein